MVSVDNIDWFVKYVRSKTKLVYADCDIVKFKVTLHDDLVYIENIRVRKTYGKGKACFSYPCYIEYEVKDTAVPFDDKKHGILFREAKSFGIVLLACDGKSVMEVKTNRDGLKVYMLAPKDEIPDIEKYRLGVIRKGSKYSLKSADTASYLGLSVMRLAKEVFGSYTEWEDMLFQDSSVGHKYVDCIFAPIGNAQVFTRDVLFDEVNSLYGTETESKVGLKYRIYDVLIRLTELEEARYFRAISLGRGLANCSYWRTMQGTTLNLLSNSERYKEVGRSDDLRD